MKKAITYIKKKFNDLLDKSFGHLFERFIGFAMGILIGYLVLSNWHQESGLLSDKYYDVIIKVSSSVFGFLLTILALIVNSSSTAVAEMREHSSYARLIKYNRVAVILAFLIIVFSVILFLIVNPSNGIECYMKKYNDCIPFKLLICSHVFLCVWSAIDTAIFVRIFYKIVLPVNK